MNKLNKLLIIVTILFGSLLVRASGVDLVPIAPNKIPLSKVEEIYFSIAGGYNFTQRGSRASFVENGVEWTIIGAQAPIITPTIYPEKWSVIGDGFDVLVVPEPISNYRILPFTEPIENAVKSDIVYVTGAKGEFEPASFIIRSGDNDLANVFIEVTDLHRDFMRKNDDNDIAFISKENIDVRVVKCWYQAGINIDDVNTKNLVPELLLHDDDIIRVDYNRQVNIIKNFEFIEDKETLVPFYLPRRTNKQIWLTIYIPKGIVEGQYLGDINIFVGDEIKRTLKLSVRVLPFELPDPVLDYSIYYLARYSEKYKGRPGFQYKNGQQMLSELKDMIAHGISNPTVVVDHEELPSGIQDLGKLHKAIELRKKAGISLSKPLLYIDWKQTHSNNLEKYESKIRRIVEAAQREGLSEVYIYGKDEASETELKKLHDVYKCVHKAGAKNFVAGWLSGFLKYGIDVLDLFIVNGMLGIKSPQSSTSGPTAEQITEAKAKNKKMWIYNNPQMGIEQPDTYRYNFGFYLWAIGMNGACNYAYQEGDPWDDFNSTARYRSHTMAYPTINKPIPTIQWEGWREGVDDIRYLTLLLKWKVDVDHLRVRVLDNKRPSTIRTLIIEELIKEKNLREKITSKSEK